ncbi:ABC transporter substrate-binding protein, partial [Candidatus Frankia alpina]
MRRRYGLYGLARAGLARAGLAAALAALVVACGGGSDGASGSAAASKPAAKGSPVKLMIIAPTGTAGTNYPEMVAATRAAVRGVNARGGIGGRPVELVHCNERNDATAAKKCAQQAVDSGVLAVVSEVSGAGGIMPILQNAGIPSIGSADISADGSELSSPV